MPLNHVVQQLNARKTLPAGVEMRSICDSDGRLVVCERTLEEFAAPTAAKDYLTEDEWMRLAWHFHNGNTLRDFAMYLIRKDNTAGVTRSKTVTYRDALQSTWKAMTQENVRPFAAVAYPSQNRPESTWFCIDVDDHDGRLTATEHMPWLMSRLLTGIKSLLKEGDSRAVIVESSGRGYHLFLISPESIPISDWFRYLGRLLLRAGVDRKEWGLEFYPPSTGRRRGVRLPGSANPSTWNPANGNYKVSRFTAVCGLKSLIEGLPPISALDARFNKRRFSSLLKRDGTVTAEGDGPAGDQSPDPWENHVDALRLLREYAITAPTSRRNALASLIGGGILHFSKEVLWRIGRRQHEQACPPCRSSLEIHRIDFEELYDGLLHDHLSTLSVAERDVYDRLSTSARKMAFLIAFNFARYSARRKQWGDDGRFPFSGLDLACRLQRGIRNSYNDRRALIELGCIRKVQDCIPCQKAEHFVWMLPSGPAGGYQQNHHSPFAGSVESDNGTP